MRSNPLIIGIVVVFPFGEFCPVQHAHVQGGVRPVQIVVLGAFVGVGNLPVGHAFHDGFHGSLVKALLCGGLHDGYQEERSKKEKLFHSVNAF